MKTKSGKKGVVFACVAVILVAAVAVGIFVGKPLLEQRQLEQQFTQNRHQLLEKENKSASDSLSFYDEKTPLSQVEPQEMKKLLPQAVAAIGYEQPEDARLFALPEDLHYYDKADASGEPAVTIPKGTVVALYGDPMGWIGMEGGYGLACYPDYQQGWRYGQMLVAETGDYDAFYNAWQKSPSYYVQTKDLETIAAAFYDLHKEDVGYIGNYNGKEDFVFKIVRQIDQNLYDTGYFLSPDLS